MKPLFGLLAGLLLAVGPAIAADLTKPAAPTEKPGLFTPGRE